MPKPYIEQPGVFASGELRKSFHSGGLNKSRTFSGGGSGYRSEARKPLTDNTKYKSVGDILPSRVVKTTIHYKARVRKELDTGGDIVYETIVKKVSKSGYVPTLGAFTTMPFTFKVVYEDREGKKMTITNTNIR